MLLVEVALGVDLAEYDGDNFECDDCQKTFTSICRGWPDRNRCQMCNQRNQCHHGSDQMDEGTGRGEGQDDDMMAEDVIMTEADKGNDGEGSDESKVGDIADPQAAIPRYPIAPSPGDDVCGNVSSNVSTLSLAKQAFKVDHYVYVQHRWAVEMRKRNGRGVIIKVYPNGTYDVRFDSPFLFGGGGHTSYRVSAAEIYTADSVKFNDCVDNRPAQLREHFALFEQNKRASEQEEASTSTLSPTSPTSIITPPYSMSIDVPYAITVDDYVYVSRMPIPIRFEDIMNEDSREDGRGVVTDVYSNGTYDVQIDGQGFVSHGVRATEIYPADSLQFHACRKRSRPVEERQSKRRKRLDNWLPW